MNLTSFYSISYLYYIRFSLHSSCLHSTIIDQNLIRVGFLKFVMHDKLMNVHVYTCYDFVGQETESEEMRPKWFSVKDINFDNMWPDDKYWLPQVIKGKRFIARFEYGDDDETITDYQISIQDQAP